MKRTPFCHNQRHCFPNKHPIHLVKNSHYLSLWICPCCPAKGSFKQAILLPYTLPSSYPVIFPVLLPSCNRLYFSEILDLQNYSSVMQMGSFAEIRIHHKHCFTGLGLIFFLELFATIPFLPNPFLSRCCSYIQTPFPVALVWLEFILSFSS